MLVPLASGVASGEGGQATWGDEMKRLFSGLMLAVAMLAATPALAQSNEASKRLALSHRFIELLQAEQMGTMLGQMVVQMSPSVSDEMSEAEADEFQAMMGEIAADMMPRLFDAMAPVYAEIFTLEELEGLVAFYESDIGQSLLRKNYESAPQIMAAINGVMPQLMLEMGDKMCDHYECTPDQRREMKAAMNEAAAAYSQ